MRPIEPGCHCIVIKDSEDPQNVGVGVIAEAFLGDVNECVSPTTGELTFLAGQGEVWLVTGPLTNRSCPSENGWEVYGPGSLMRIDGGEPESVESEEDRGGVA